MPRLKIILLTPADVLAVMDRRGRMAFKFCAGNPHHHLQAHSVYTFTELYNDSIPSIPILMTQTQHIENLLDELLQNILDEEDIIRDTDPSVYYSYSSDSSDSSD